MLRTDDHKPGICQLYLSLSLSLILLLPLHHLLLSLILRIFYSITRFPLSCSFGYRLSRTLTLYTSCPSSHPSHVSPVFLFIVRLASSSTRSFFLSDSSLFRSLVADNHDRSSFLSLVPYLSRAHPCRLWETPRAGHLWLVKFAMHEMPNRGFDTT